MDTALSVINESQWILCLFQITILMSISWFIGRIALHRFPDISASIGVVAFSVSAGLLALTWAGVPRPFALTTAQPFEVAESITGAAPVDCSEKQLDSSVDPQPSPASWMGSLVGMFTSIEAPAGRSVAAESNQQWPIGLTQMVAILMWLTMLGGFVGVFRVVHSSITILQLARSSSPVEDPQIQTELKRILALLSLEHPRHQSISVRQYKGTGSPFVSWLTGRTIFVPQSFLNWSGSERSVSLAHEIGHLQRRDHYCRLITQLTFCLTWAHPLAWILHRQTLLAQELAADQVAAQATQNPKSYCRVLARLALRFDAECQQPSVLGVSVSSSLIRRITMLKEISFHRLPCSRFANRCITLFALIACSWIGCWSVAAQDTVLEKQTDSKVVAASHTTPVKMFSQPATVPWEVVGNQAGYYNLQVQRVRNHPYFSATFTPLDIPESLNTLLRSAPNKEPSFEQFGLSFDEITQLQGAAGFRYIFAPDDPSGKPYEIGFTLPKVEVTARNPVDWPSLIKALDFEKMQASYLLDSDVDSKINIDEVRDSWLDSAEKSRAYTFEAPMALRMSFSPPSETKKAVWETVSGGAVTILYDIGTVEAYPEDYQEEDAFKRANHEMTVATETAAWGIDFSPDLLTHQLRFVAVPKEGVLAEELLKKFEALKAAIADLEELSQFSMEQTLLDQLKKTKTTIVQGKQRNGKLTKAYLLVEGEYRFDLVKFIKELTN